MENPFELILNHLKTLETAIEALGERIQPPALVSTNPVDQVYTKAEAAELLHISEHTLDSYIRERKIPYCKPEARVYFLHSDLIAWMKQHRTATLAEQLASYEANRKTIRPRGQRK